MSFVQPWMLWALPLVALPIIIHLINQRRFRTIKWGAMMFLLAASRMSKGYARLRQWLILAVRTLAIAGLIFAVSRPLASGWLSLAGGGTIDTAIIVIDRSPSMQQRGPGGLSKLDAGLDQLVDSLKALSANRWVLVDSATNTAVEIEGPEALQPLLRDQGVGASADIPALLQTVYDYVRDNRPTRTEVFLCSDDRRNDWDPESGRWTVIRESFNNLPQPVRFHLLAFDEVASLNRGIRVTGVRRVTTSANPELLLSFRIEQESAPSGPTVIPVQLELDGVRTEIPVEIDGTEFEVQDQPVPLSSAAANGWGRVSLPADENLSDNDFYFVYSEPAPRKTLIVAEAATDVRPLELAAAISAEPGVGSNVQVIPIEQLPGVDWMEVALLLWQAPLPEGATAGPVEAFVKRGGQVIFFPPTGNAPGTYQGVSWGEWQEPEPVATVTSWVGDQDLLAKSRSGAALPVGQLQVRRYRDLAGDLVSLATLDGGAPLLARTITEGQNVYFCTTTVAATDSTLAREGIVLYVMVQRALAAGADAAGGTQQLAAGALPIAAGAGWQRLSTEANGLSTLAVVLPGAYEADGKILAINRGAAEDRAEVLSAQRIADLFQTLEFDRINTSIGRGRGLVEEIWRIFLISMLVALLLEAALCIPSRRNAPALGTSRGMGEAAA